MQSTVYFYLLESDPFFFYENDNGLVSLAIEYNVELCNGKKRYEIIVHSEIFRLFICYIMLYRQWWFYLAGLYQIDSQSINK